MAYFEGEIPTVVSGGNNCGGFGGGFADGWWGIILIALLFGWGNNGYGGCFGGSRGGGSSEFVGYELGKMATQADVASGFNNSAVLSSLNELKLGQAGIQQTLCQGFNGINTSILTSTNQINQGICNLGYTLTSQISDCCCQTQRAIDGVKYALSQQTCDIITNQNANTQRIFDYLTNEKISSLQADKAALTAQLSQAAQTNTIINTLRPVAQPAYITCSPYQSAFGFNCNGCTGTTIQ